MSGLDLEDFSIEVSRYTLYFLSISISALFHLKDTCCSAERPAALTFCEWSGIAVGPPQKPQH